MGSIVTDVAQNLLSRRDILHPMIGAAITCFFLHCIFSILISPTVFSQVYASLKKEKQRLWNNHLVSIVHSLVSGFGIIYSLIIEDYPFKGEPHFGSMPYRTFFLSVTLGYCIYDTLDVIRRPDWASVQNILVLGHHLVILYSYYVILVNEVGCIYAAIFQANELSNALMHTRWFLYTGGFKHTTLYVIHGALMVLGYFMCRIILTSYGMAVIVYQGLYTELRNNRLLLSGLISGSLFTIIQFIFFYSVTSGYFSFLRKRKKQKLQ
eukprot:gb/GECH01009098.1/.p1 GENE.gb/GECH01009098.1/~~gb/GECH01009098.1/.p1  ORF type:complete len:266 (+),score=3.43 gb/GECH01009098.1/:1-798(+)